MIIIRFERKFHKRGPDDCWPWHAAKKDNGYGVMNVGGKTLKAHRLSYELYVGKIPTNTCVLHKCDNSACVNPSHLYLGTNDDNIDDMIRRGRCKSGATKLNEEAVKVIKFFENKVPRRVLADLYHVSIGIIHQIYVGKVWRNVVIN